MSILIQSVEWNGRPTDLLIEGQTIAQVAPMIDRPADTVIDGRGKAVIPGLINAHTHAAMTRTGDLAERSQADRGGCLLGGQAGMS